MPPRSGVAPGSALLTVVLVHLLPTDPLADLPGLRLKFLPRPRAVVVLVRLQAFVLLDAEQDERLPRPRVEDARRGGFGGLQCLDLLFGQFDHGCSFPLSYYLGAAAARRPLSAAVCGS